MANNQRGEFLGYVPTVDGRPATFCNDYQLCTSGSRNFRIVVLPSLREVRRQIAASVKNRKRDGYQVALSDYGYVRVGREA